MLTNEQLQIANKEDYFCNSRFISGRIMEYDIRAANISVLREANIISDEYYKYMLSVDKMYREQFIGWQIKKEKEESGNKSAIEGSITYKTIYEGIKSARIQLFDANNIQPYEVVRISHDAVYVNRPSNLDITQFGKYIEFRQKIIASTCIKLSSTLIIFYWNDINGLNLEVKGISDESKIAEHQNYILSFIGSVLLTYERAGTVDAIHLIEDFYNDYINRRLSKEFYKELNPRSMYKILHSGYYLTDINDINLLDISYNGELIRELWKILMTKYK